ncbi:MAG: DUF3352 domain-containing protein, partial [Chloroflexota bacterium]|nr:DUF3352 domain-containing protein [Chloroflexota bacterium]
MTPVSRPKPIRWIVALLATVLVVVTGIGLAMLATGSRTTSAQGPSFLPPDTVFYMEGRLDLPGDQRDNLISFIGKFPGFADPAAFDLKVNDWLDRLTRDASEGGYVYTADIKPWFDGEFAIGVTEVPEVSAESGGDPLGMSQMPSFVGTLSVTDQAALDTFLSRLRADAAGATFTETTQGDVTIVTYQPAGAPDGTFSYAATDGSLLFAAEPGDIVAALEVRAGTQPSLAESDEFKARFAALPPERLGAVYMDLSAFRASMESGLASLDPTTAGLVRDALDQIPRAMAGSIRAEADRMIVDIVVIPSEGMAVPSARSTALAAHAPATSAVYFETRDVGQTIKTFVSAVVEPIMGGDTVLDQVEDFLGSPVEDFLLWMEDAAVSVAVDGDQVTFGLASTVTDSTVAAQRVERLTTAIRAAAAFGQVPFEIQETEVLGAQVTTIAAVSDPAM